MSLNTPRKKGEVGDRRKRVSMNNNRKEGEVARGGKGKVSFENKPNDSDGKMQLQKGKERGRSL